MPSLRDAHFFRISFSNLNRDKKEADPSLIKSNELRYPSIQNSLRSCTSLHIHSTLFTHSFPQFAIQDLCCKLVISELINLKTVVLSWVSWYYLYELYFYCANTKQVGIRIQFLKFYQLSSIAMSQKSEHLNM